MITPLFQEACAVHLIFGAAGVDSENIWVAIRNGQLAIVARRPRALGGKEFVVEVGSTGMSEAVLRERWPAAAAAWNALSLAERHRIASGTQVRRRAVEIIAEMVLAGFGRSAIDRAEA